MGKPQALSPPKQALFEASGCNREGECHAQQGVASLRASQGSDEAA